MTLHSAEALNRVVPWKDANGREVRGATRDHFVRRAFDEQLRNVPDEKPMTLFGWLFGRWD